MTTLTYPRTLVAGTTENVNHVQENFVSLRDLVNGNLDATNLATSAKPSNLLGEWHTVHQWNAYVGQVPNTTARFVSYLDVVQSGVSTINPPLIAPFDPAAHSIFGLTAKGRLKLAYASNGTVPGATFTWGLYGIQAISGGNGEFVVTLAGSAHSGSTVGVTPAQNELATANSAEFTLPSAVPVTVGFVTSAATAAASAQVWSVRLEVRHV